MFDTPPEYRHVLETNMLTTPPDSCMLAYKLAKTEKIFLWELRFIECAAGATTQTKKRSTPKFSVCLKKRSSLQPSADFLQMHIGLPCFTD